MKYFYCAILFLLLINKANSQQLPPYQQYRTVPAVKLNLADGKGYELKANLAKGKPLFIFVFSPECDHCQHETEEIIKNINRFKNVQIVMATPLPEDKMKAFITRYQLEKYPNITVGRDYAYILPTYYAIKNLPFHGLYNANKQLITGFEGSMTIDAILKTLGQ